MSTTSCDSIAVLTTSRIDAVLHGPREPEHLTGLELQRRVIALEDTVAQLRAIVEYERKCRKAITARLDRGERVDLSEVW